MTLPLVPVGVDDAPSIHDLFRRWELHWNAPLATPLSEVVDDLEHPHLQPDLDTRGVWLDGRLVAFGAVHHTPSGERLERVFALGRVDPAMRGRGIGRRLLAWQLERAAEKLRECDPSIPWYVRTYEWEWVDDAFRLYTRFKMEQVRWFEDLMRPLDTPDASPVPEGITIVAWDEVDRSETRDVSNASFADHWGSTPRDPEAWEHLLNSSDVRTDLSFVAMADGRAIGICLNSHYPDDEEVTGRRDGWISQLGVVRDWRRKGVAAALISRSLQAFREVEFSHAMLGVDAANPTGAAGLYRNLGFEPLHRSVASELRIPPLTD